MSTRERREREGSSPRSSSTRQSAPWENQALRCSGVDQLSIDRSVLKRWVHKTRDGRYESTPGKSLKGESQAGKRDLVQG